LKFRSLLAFILLALLVVAGCAQRETDIGSNAITGLPGDRFAVTADTATHGTDWKPPFTNGFGTSLEVGDASSLFAFFVLRFEVVTGLPDSVLPDALTLHLTNTGKSWPEFFPGLQVRIREIPDSVKWTEGVLLPGSLPGRESYPLLDSTVAGATDTTLVVSLSDAAGLWSRWRAEGDSSGGLLIEARSDFPGGRGGFVEYYSHENSTIGPPSLSVHGQAFSGDSLLSADTTLLTYATNDGYLVIDSTDINPTTLAAHQKRLLVTQGMAQRTALYFPLDTLLQSFPRSVNRAELHLFADTTNALEIRYPGQDMVLKNGFLNDSTWISHSDSLQLSRLLGSESIAVGDWQASSSELVFDVTTAVASWVENPASNGGLQILSAEELDFLSREVFYGPDADSLNKRPKLYIWFTESSYSSH
jgi:hypothetical protein